MTSMIEKVAKALYAALDDEETYVSDLTDDMTNVIIDGRVNLKDIARAAIAAMREPTREMLAGASGWFREFNAALDAHAPHDQRPGERDHPGDDASDDELD